MSSLIKKKCHRIYMHFLNKQITFNICVYRHVSCLFYLIFYVIMYLMFCLIKGII